MAAPLWLIASGCGTQGSRASDGAGGDGAAAALPLLDGSGSPTGAGDGSLPPGADGSGSGGDTSAGTLPLPGDSGSPADGADGALPPGVDGSSGSGGSTGGDGSPGWPGTDGSGTVLSSDPVAPTGLMTELLNHPERTVLTDPTPEFGWIVHSRRPNDRQSAFRILVASQASSLDNDMGDMWDSGKTVSGASINVAYAGKPLAAAGSYFWKVQTWDSADSPSGWSGAQNFVMAAAIGAYGTATEPTDQVRVAPTTVAAIGPGHSFVDFGRDAFGWVELTLDAPTDGAAIEVHIGEKANNQAVDLNPGGSIRHANVPLVLQKGLHTYRVATTPDPVNTKPPAILLPAWMGVVIPFRYVEILNSPVAFTADMVRQVALYYPWDPSASTFASSNAALGQVWELSKYSVIAPAFPGIYAAGDRERAPYEGDSYIQMLGHYQVDREFAVARYSHEYSLVHPTWPTEWKQHSVMMAWTDWMYTGNTESLAQWYGTLTTQKTLEQHVGPDGLLNTHGMRDMVDWPVSELNGFVFTDENTIINSFWGRNLQQMSEIATALGKTADAARYASMATTAIAALNQKMTDPATGLYLDGVGTTHSSLHANMFPLALGLVPASRKAAVTAYIESRGMACSVYGAQYLLEALYQAGDPDAAVALMTSSGLRSWLNMIRVGSTMTMEAWDISLKPNLDWNHAWGAAPANILPRYLLGVRPLAPGFAKAAIAPQPGSLSHAEGLVPTIRGPIHVVVDRPAGATSFTIGFEIPVNMTADVLVPAPAGSACNAILDGQPAPVTVRNGQSWVVDVGSAPHELRCP